MTRPRFITLILLLLLLSITHLGSSRIISLTSDGAAESNSTSRSSTAILKLKLTTTTVTCEPVYGFLPCTTELWGQLFLIVVYEYLISLGNNYVSEGSELFFNMIGPGIFGASLFHILGTIPMVVLMLVSGLNASTTSVEEQAEMGMGFLAGSAVMLLTLVWGSCIAFGSTDFSRTFSSDNQNQKPFSFTGFGVSTDAETSYTARIMILSMVPFLILQLPKVLNSSAGTRVTVLVSLLVTIVLLFAYCFYQVFQPWIQNRRFEYLLHKYIDDKLLRLFVTNGNPNITFMKELFQEVDKNKNANISPAELRVLFLGIQLKEEGEASVSNTKDFADKVMEAFDTSGDARIDEAEFVNGMVKYISDAVQSSKTDQDPNGFKFFGRHAKSGSKEEEKSLVSQKKDSSNSPQSGSGKSWLNYLKASFYLILGTAITALLGLPLMEAVADFATAANISSFAVSYVVIPLALNYRQVLSTITSARKKTRKAISLTLSEIYGAVFMNNMMGLAMFLALVYIRNLSWDVSAEVLVVLVICTAMGIFTSVCTKFPIWTSFVAFLLYPISLLLLYVLTTVFGWS
ncbi:sodium/calcium exchanger NCL2-like [Rhododendron vialii]|uniref:sodium/calcium exchanger NCL2-like n=1 Tax=Rhododendron vialii TaxID=182163 RepID=UPI00265DF272|nr:sodium/calcium exchanger NCL2-like [Rhododendron vialii]